MIRRCSALPILVGCLVSGCSGNLTETYVAGVTATGDFVAPVRTVSDLRYAGVLKQKYDFSCGSAALASLLKYHYGRPVTEADLFKGMWVSGDQPQIRRLGFSLLDMKRYLAARDLPANGFQVSLQEVAEGGTPGIALINVRGYKHFIVVKGIRGDEVLVGDPSTGITVMPVKKFQAMWNGIYFIIQPGAARGQFNGASQWASYTRAPLGAGYPQPVSQQQLALTAPFYRDF